MAALVQKRETLVDVGASVVLAYTSDVTAGNLLTVEASRFTSSTTDAFAAGDLAQSAGTATVASKKVAVTTAQKYLDYTRKS